jgi:hypothetical protein
LYDAKQHIIYQIYLELQYFKRVIANTSNNRGVMKIFKTLETQRTLNATMVQTLETIDITP